MHCYYQDARNPLKIHRNLPGVKTRLVSLRSW
ncbi:unnamed protein product [Ectocarpus sp. CCAP 1310/34]|nr:unnamed protein product [Ectocarpus sp. CCAP 1310/34]